MAAPAKLSDSDVKKIRRRVRAGEQQTLLALEYGVNRKTIRRRLDELEREEREQAKRVAKKRLQRQAAREKRKLLERERAAGLPTPIEHSDSSDHPPRPRARAVDPYHVWLDTRKNLSGRALVEANGLVRLARDGDRRWVDRSRVDGYLESGWVLDVPPTQVVNG